MLNRRFFFLGVLGLTALISPARAADTAPATPTLVVRVRSLDGLLADMKYLVGLSGKTDDAKKLDPLLGMANSLQGIDRTRPIGVYGLLDPDGNFMDSKFAVMVPIKDEKAFIGALENFRLQPSKEDDGTYTINPPQGNITVYLRFANNYAYATAMNRAAIDKDKLIAPAKIFSAGYPELLSLTFRLDQIPDTLKQIAISQVEPRIAALDDEKPKNETKEQHEFKVLGAKEVTKHFVAILQEGAQIDLRLDVNRTGKKLKAEFSISGKPNSSVEAHLKALGSAQSLFGGLMNADAAANAILHATLPEGMQNALGKIVDEAMKNGLAKEQDAAKRAQAEKLLKAVSPTLKSGELDAGFSLRGPGEGKTYTLVAGVKVKEGTSIESAVKDILKALPDEAKSFIKLDADSEGDVKIHRFDIQSFYDADARKAFGDNPVYLALRADGLLVSAGAGGLGALKQAITAGPAAAPPLSFDVALARFIPLMTQKGKVDPTAAAKKAFGDNPDAGKLHVTVEGGKALKVRLEMDAAAFQFFGLVGQK